MNLKTTAVCLPKHLCRYSARDSLALTSGCKAPLPYSFVQIHLADLMAQKPGNNLNHLIDVTCFGLYTVFKLVYMWVDRVLTVVAS